MTRPQDHFGRRAKKAGYPARSVFKLQEIDRRARLFRPGQRVLDLGAAPGSWTLYAAESVGPRGTVLGIDIRPTDTGLPANASIRQGDLLQIEPSGIEGCGDYDVVLSDMAPDTSGHRHLDQYRSYELYARALLVAREVLKPGGCFLGKIFQGAEFEQARKQTREAFTRVRVLKPPASRKESYEVYLLALEKK
jgi:23S rRNA (uridine2552-2'-O)-methyltransferase